MARLLNFFRWRRDRLEQDLDRELRYHLDRRVEEMINDGLSEPEARRRASIELGGVPQVKEAVRDTWIWRWLDAAVLDLRYAIRSLTRSWGFTLGAGAVLALAIGANVAIFSVVNAVLLQPLGYPDAGRLVSVETLWTNTGRVSQDVSGPDFLDWQAQNDVFEKMATSYGEDGVATIVGDRAVFANDRYVSADFFAVFGQPASAGRLLTERDVPSGDAMPTVAVVAYHWATAHFGSAEAAIGKTITPDYFKTLEIPIRSGRDLDRTDTKERPPVAIINETLARTAFQGESALGRHIRWNTKAPWMEIVGVVADTRLQDPGQPPPPVIFVASAQGTGGSLSILARTSLDEKSLATTLGTLVHDANPTVPVRFETMDELFAGALAYPRFRTQVIGVFAAAAALLAAVGIFSVLAYLVGQRRRELAVRRAVGAQAGDVIRLIVGQGLRLAAIGLVLGLAGAVAMARLLEGFLYEIGPWDVGTYLMAIAVLGIAVLLATLLPAIRAARVAPLIALQQE